MNKWEEEWTNKDFLIPAVSGAKWEWEIINKLFLAYIDTKNLKEEFFSKEEFLI